MTPNERSLRWRRANPDKVAAADMKHRYGITFESRAIMLREQDNKCAVCEKEFNIDTVGSKPHIDHNHVDGKVRGLLCHNCNLGLGYFKDNPEILQKAIAYLKRQATSVVGVTVGSGGRL